MSKKPVAVVLPSWDSNEPRFITMECKECSDDRQFKNGKCVYNQRLGFCYSVNEIVEVLNNEKELNELRTENNRLLAYNSACEDTLLNVDVTLHQMITKAGNERDKKFKAAKIYNSSSDIKDIKKTSMLLDTVFYWEGYLKALKDLKNEIFPKESDKND